MGGGVEFLVSQNFSVGAEALYVNLGGGEAFAGFGDNDLDLVTASLRATFRFGGRQSGIRDKGLALPYLPEA